MNGGGKIQISQIFQVKKVFEIQRSFDLKYELEIDIEIKNIVFRKINFWNIVEM